MTPRFFNTAGPCKPDLHYILPPAARLPEVLSIVDQQSYFVLHAPRQVGKTTALQGLAQQLTKEGRFTGVLVSMEVGAPFSDDPGAAELAILSQWRGTAERWLPLALRPPPWPEAPAGQRIGMALQEWARHCNGQGKPLVVFLDEADSLQDQTLVALLRQVRAGYSNRPELFPQSLALIGMRDVRDYKVKAGGSDRLNSSSPFNIKVASLTLRNFTTAETTELLTQHTRATGQVFESAALARIFELTQGQPWLVNALGREIVEHLLPDRSQPIKTTHVEQARENLIQRMDTHLDSLAERLREDRVKRIIEPMLAGETLGDIPDDDLRYVVDLGLCKNGAGLAIANPIYQEVIPRVLARTTQHSIRLPKPTWLDDKGRMVAEKLLAAFLDFWRENGEALLKSAPYHEVAPHLVLMAFLHRVVNGGGTIQREYAIGTRRMDLCVRHGELVLGIELKVWHSKQPDPLKDGLRQLDEYLAGLGQNTGWLVIFDRRPRRPSLARRLGVKTSTSPGGRHIQVIRA